MQNKIKCVFKEREVFLSLEIVTSEEIPLVIDFQKWQNRNGSVDSKAACNCQSNSQKIEIFTTEQIRQENLR